MPRKRVPKTERETPAMRRLRAEILEELTTPLIALTPEQERASAAYEAKFWRRVEKRIEKGATEIDAILAEIEREDRKAAEKAGPPRDGYAAHRASVARKTAAAPTPTPAPPVAAIEKSATTSKRKRLPPGFAGYVVLDGQDS